MIRKDIETTETTRRRKRVDYERKTAKLGAAVVFF